MSDNPTGSDELSIEEAAEDTCKMIQRETIGPLSWIFPASSSCVSCILLTGGHPEMMAAYCPRVIQRLAEQSEPEEPEGQSES